MLGIRGFSKVREARCPVVGALVAAARDDRVRVHVRWSKYLTRWRLFFVQDTNQCSEIAEGDAAGSMLWSVVD